MNIFNNKDYKKNTKQLIYMLSTVYCFDIFGSPHVLAMKYEDVFTEDIYDQRKILNTLGSPSNSPEEVDEKLVEALVQAKESALERNCIERIKNKIQTLEKKYIPATKKTFWSETLNTITLSFSTMGRLLGPKGEIGGIVVGCIMKYLGHKVFEENFSGPDSNFIKQEISKLEIEIEDLKNGLLLEPTFELEKAYVKRKRHLNNSTLEKEIENGLLGLRKTDYYLGSKIKQSISYSLKLPVKKTIPCKSVESWDARTSLLEKIRNNPIIKNFNTELQEKLETIITDISDISSHPQPSHANRRTFYFSGNPSCGKTTMAKEIAKILNLSYYEITLQDASEVNKENLEGANSLFSQNANPGWLAKALMSSNGVKESVKNAVLIINDLDRISLTENPNVYNFLLAYLDPNKKTYFNQFFNADIDLSSLIVIITANTKIPENEYFDAFKSRISRLVEFPDLSGDIIKNIAKTEINRIVSGFSALKYFDFDYMDPTTIKIKYNFDFLPLDNYKLKLMGVNPSTESLNRIKQGELGVFCKGEDLFCKIHNKKEKELFKTRGHRQGLPPEVFERILKNLKIEFIDSQISLAEEEERQHNEIIPDDEKILLQYTLCNNYTSLSSDDIFISTLSDLTSNFSCVEGASDGLSFCLKSGVKEEDKAKTTLRQLIDTGTLSSTISAFVNKIMTVSNNKFLQAKEGKNVGDLTPYQLYLQAAVCGHDAAAYKLYEVLKKSNNKFANFWYEQAFPSGNSKPPQKTEKPVDLGNANQTPETPKAKCSSNGNNTFHTTALKGQRDLLSALLDQGSEGINATNDLGDTPIMVAASQGHIDIVKLLHGKKAKLAEKNNAGDTILQIAQSKGHAEIVEFLLEKKPELITSFKDIKFLEHIEIVVNKNPTRYQKAFKIIGEIYLEGEIVSANFEKAWKYYTIAQKSGDTSFSLDYSMYLFSIRNDYHVGVGVFNQNQSWDHVNTIDNRWKAHKTSSSTPSSISCVSFKKQPWVTTTGQESTYWRERNKIWLASSNDNKNWGNAKEINPSWEAQGGVSLCGFKKKLFLAHIGKDNGVYLANSENGKKWGECIKINRSDVRAYDTINLTSFKEKLYLAHISQGGQIWLVSSEDGLKWGGDKNILASWKLNTHTNVAHTAVISLTSFKNKLYLGFIGGEHDPWWGAPKDMWLTSSSDGETWDKPIRIMDKRTAAGINLTAFKGKLYFACRSDKRIWLTSSEDGQAWGEPKDSNWDDYGRFCLAPLLKVTENQ